MVHRPTLNKPKKPFKSRHASKGSIKEKLKGKVNKNGNHGIRTSTAPLSKVERKNKAKQIMNAKRHELDTASEIFHGRDGAPRMIAVVPLSSSVQPAEIVKALVSGLIGDVNEDELPVIPSHGVFEMYSDRFRQKLLFLIPTQDTIAVLDSTQAADFVLFGLSATEQVDASGEALIRTVESQGVSNCFACIQNLKDVGVKAQPEVQRSLFSFFSHFFPATDKIYSIQTRSDSATLVRTLCQKTPKGITWRDVRSYLFAQDVSVDHDAKKLTVKGYVRGRALDVSRLVHLPGIGDFALDQVTVGDHVILPDPGLKDTLDALAPLEVNMETDDDDNDDKGKARTTVGRLDGIGNQAAEEEEGMRSGNVLFGTASNPPSKSRSLPQGMSSYQASWIHDDDLYEDEDDDDTTDAVDDEMQDDADNDGHQSDTFVGTEYTANDSEQDMFVDLNPDEEEKQYKDFQQRAKDDLAFPDELELPPTTIARERLMRYRGVKSLRTCLWDENEPDSRKPSDWTRLYRLSNYKATKARVLRGRNANQDSCVDVGSLAVLTIDISPATIPTDAIVSKLSTNPLVVYSLLEYEHKLSSMRYSITLSSEYDGDPIPSKTPLIMQTGFRRLLVQPVFSQAGSSPNGVVRYERFLHKGRTATVSAIAPITFGSVPILYFKSTPDNALQLMATGTVLDPERSRVIAKRVILTGHPLKIHKRLVTVRYMFFNPEDVQWYKRVPLFTKSGRSGYIKESLGTHGYFKATFDGQISSQDTVAMALYKRVWPRHATLWTE